MEVVEACEFTLNSEVKETIQGQSRRSDKSLHTLVVQQTEVKYWNRHAKVAVKQRIISLLLHIQHLHLWSDWSDRN